MQKASFFVAALFDSLFRDTELLIQSLRVDQSSLKRDTGQGSNSKANIEFLECHGGVDEWWQAPAVGNERDR